MKEMPDDYVIKSFLVSNKETVKGFLDTEYDEEEVMNLFKEEGRAEERINTEREKQRADNYMAELAKYKARFGELEPEKPGIND